MYLPRELIQKAISHKVKLMLTINVTKRVDSGKHVTLCDVTMGTYLDPLRIIMPCWGKRETSLLCFIQVHVKKNKKKQNTKYFHCWYYQGRPLSCSELPTDFCPGCQLVLDRSAGIWTITIPAQNPALWKIKSCWQFFVRPQVSVLTSECPHVIYAPAAIPVHHRDCSWPSAGR